MEIIQNGSNDNHEAMDCIPSESECDIVVLFIRNIESKLSRTISSDTVRLIALYAASITKRICAFSDRVMKRSGTIHVMNGDTIKKYTSSGWGTVLCGDGEPMDRSKWTDYEMIWRIKKMDNGFQIGYIYGSIQEFDFEQRLGFGTNGRNSVGIYVGGNGFYSYDGELGIEPLQCESADAPSSFTKQGQIWKISWDLVNRKMEISLKNQQRGWIPMTHIAMKQEHDDVVPVIALRGYSDSIKLITE